MVADHHACVCLDVSIVAWLLVVWLVSSYHTDTLAEPCGPHLHLTVEEGKIVH